MAIASLETLTFSSMTWEILDQQYGIALAPKETLFPAIEPIEPSSILTGTLGRSRRARLINERAKAYRLVDPVLAELEVLRDGKIASLPEVPLEVKGVAGLRGCPDFLISGSTTYKIIPIVAIVEAKKDDIDAGLPQCVAELYASYLLNDRRPGRIYGCVTTGRDWQFVRLDGQSKRAVVDLDTRYINELPILLGIFCQIIDVSLAELDAAG